MVSLIQKSKTLDELFSIPENNQKIKRERFFKNIVNPGRAAFKFVLPLDKKMNVLDFGCGYGSVSISLAPHVKKVYGTDLDMDRLIFTQKRAELSKITNLQLLCCGGDKKLPFSDNQFDLVIVNGVLEWLPTSIQGSPQEVQENFLREIYRILKDDGSLYLGIENRYNYQYFLGKPDDHSHLIFASLLPRFFSNIYSMIIKNKSYRTYTHSHKKYLEMFNKAGFKKVETFFPSPNYKYIEKLYSNFIEHNHSYLPGQTFRESLVNDIRNSLFSSKFLQNFAPAFSFIVDKKKKKTNLLTRILKKHFHSKITTSSFLVSEKNNFVKVIFKVKKREYSVILPLVNDFKSQQYSQKEPHIKGSLDNQKYFIYHHPQSPPKCNRLENSKKYLNKKINHLRGSLMGWLIKFILRLEPLLKIDSKRIIFGAMNGRFYGDNSRYLYEWILKHERDLKPVWFTSSKRVYQRLKKEGKPVIKYNSLKGLYFLMKTPLACFTNSAKDIFFDIDLLPKRLKLIALRHGRSVKRVRFARKKDKIGKKEIESRLKEGKKILFAISTSSLVSDMQEECLQIGKDKHIITGYPRNDSLLTTPTPVQAKKFRQNFLKNKKYKKVVLYAPSWRHGREATQFFPFPDFNLGELSNFLKKKNIAVLLRPHINDLLKYEEINSFIKYLASSSPNIILATHKEEADPYKILPFVDLLITDYSAIYHDFLLFNRPIILIPYDYKNFLKQNGFLYNYKKLAPGPLIYTQEDLIQEIDKLFSGKDSHLSKRKKLGKLIYQQQDTNSSQRITKLIKEYLTNLEK